MKKERIYLQMNAHDLQNDSEYTNTNQKIADLVILIIYRKRKGMGKWHGHSVTKSQQQYISRKFWYKLMMEEVTWRMMHTLMAQFI